jgi:hypothetical protein
MGEFPHHLANWKEVERWLTSSVVSGAWIGRYLLARSVLDFLLCDQTERAAERLSEHLATVDDGNLTKQEREEIASAMRAFDSMSQRWRPIVTDWRRLRETTFSDVWIRKHAELD